MQRGSSVDDRTHSPLIQKTAMPVLGGVSPEDLAVQALEILAGRASLELKGKVQSRGGIILCLADRKPGGFWRQLP